MKEGGERHLALLGCALQGGKAGRSWGRQAQVPSQEAFTGRFWEPPVILEWCGPFGGRSAQISVLQTEYGVQAQPQPVPKQPGPRSPFLLSQGEGAGSVFVWGGEWRGMSHPFLLFSFLPAFFFFFLIFFVVQGLNPELCAY